MTTASRLFYRPEDLAAMPDDNQRYEVIDGGLVVTPMAGGEHQRLVTELVYQLRSACPAEYVVLPGAELHLGGDAVIPDVVVVRNRPELPAVFAADDVVLVVEVTSPRQEGRDRVTKRAVYERSRVPTYVIADMGLLTVLELDPVTLRYEESATGKKVTLERPYPVTLTA